MGGHLFVGIIAKTAVEQMCGLRSASIVMFILLRIILFSILNHQINSLNNNRTVLEFGVDVTLKSKKFSGVPDTTPDLRSFHLTATLTYGQKELLPKLWTLFKMSLSRTYNTFII